MKKYKAILFDRDETISYDDPGRLSQLAEFIDGLLAKPGFFNSLEIGDWRDILWDAMERNQLQYFDINTLEKEEFIWREFFKVLLLREGYTKDIEKKAEQAYKIFNILEVIRAYPESEQVFKILKRRGYMLGIISNCFPTLKKSLNMIGLDKYVDCFVNSSSAGYRKPDPGIFRITVEQLNIDPSEAIYIDNLYENVMAAREFGFTSFLIDRSLPSSSVQDFQINNLMEILYFLGIDSNN